MTIGPESTAPMTCHLACRRRDGDRCALGRPHAREIGSPPGPVHYVCALAAPVDRTTTAKDA